MERPVRLLWTGGWDSTFRLMMLVLVHEQPVQPYYLIDETRESFPLEIRTMAEIKEAVAVRWPSARRLILPTIYGARRDLRLDQAITRSYRNLYDRSRLGGQYDWLARWLAQLGITDVDIGITDSDAPDDTANVFLKPHTDLVSDSDRGQFSSFRDDVDDPDLLAVFGRYLFPLIHLSKPDMQRIARENDFADVLETTWFCHQPRADGRPCGVCHPCVTTRQQGMRRRVPAPPLAYRLRRLVAPCLPRWIKRPIKDRLGWE